MFWVDYLSRFVHIATAITLVGGSVFMLVALIPAANLLSSESHAQLASAVQGRWKRFVHLGILLFLLTGLYNYWRGFDLHRGDGLYHGLVGTKILLALALFAIVSVLVGRSAKFEGMRANRSKWLGVVVLLATLIVGISSFVKVRGSGLASVEASSTTEQPLGSR